MKKILMFSVEYPPKTGGAGKVAFDTVNKLLKNGYRVDVLSNSTACVQKGCRHLNVRQLPIIFFIMFGLVLKNKIDEYDTVILNDLGAALTACFFLDDIQLKKTIVYLHGSEPEKIFLNPKWSYRFFNIPMRYRSLLNKCKKVVCVSHFMKEKILNALPTFKQGKCVVVHNGADTTLFYNDNHDLRNEYNLPKNSILIFSASRVVKQKGYHDTYIVFKRLIQAGKPYIWFIAGDGDYKEELSSIIDKDGLSDKVFFLGRLGPNELRKYYSSVDVFVLLSKFKEAFGLVYLESLHCGVPVIGRNIGGTNEIVVNGKNGYLVDNEDDCFYILEHELFKKFSLHDIKKTIPDYNREFELLISIL